jgi:outer membrane lipoprotein-sorting protein
VKKHKTDSQTDGDTMNCAECRDNLVALIEGLLDPEESLQCRNHLETCTACREEHASIAGLQQRLITRSERAAGVSLVEPVMRRVLHNRTEKERKKAMFKLFSRWGIGAAAAVAVLALVVILVTPGGQANAAEVLSRGVKAVASLSSIHITCKLRTLPADNFSLIMPDQDFVPVEVWKQFDDPKWRIDKPGRMAVMDGHSTILYIRDANTGMKIDRPSPSAFDTDWLHEVANISQVLTSEIHAAESRKNSPMISEETGADGLAKVVVSIETQSNLPDGDYLKNKFFGAADTRRLYVFDKQSNRLEAVKVYLLSKDESRLIFEVTGIDYNPQIDPAVFHPEFPDNVAWAPEETPVIANNQAYASMTAAETARAFFEAFARRDWDEAAKFWPMPIQDSFKDYLGGVEIISMGKPFRSMIGPQSYIPYEIRLSNGEVKKHNLALRNDNAAGRWMVDGGI